MSDEKPLLEGVGKFTYCRPVAEDPEIVEQRHRGVCLLRPLPQCGTCPNGKFTLYFKKPEAYLEQVRCPRWEFIASLHRNQPPDKYVVTELATCKDRPFAFCGSCPSREKLAEIGIDKTKEGWYQKWKRLMKEEEE